MLQTLGNNRGGESFSVSLEQRSEEGENVTPRKASQRDRGGGNREKVKKSIIIEDEEEIEEVFIGYFSKLFQGYHTPNGNIGAEPFQPNFKDLDFLPKMFPMKIHIRMLLGLMHVASLDNR